MKSGVYDHLLNFYESGQVPWDLALPPPEVMGLVSKMAPGRAIDLGCGYGRAAIYLAGHGWEVDGVDFIAPAIDEARLRAERAGVKRATFHLGSVMAMPFLSGPYDLAVDVGCAHGLDPAGLLAYRQELVRLLRPGALYLLFARLATVAEDPATTLTALDEGAFRALFEGPFVVEMYRPGLTIMSDDNQWHSAWFWLRRTAQL